MKYIILLGIGSLVIGAGVQTYKDEGYNQGKFILFMVVGIISVAGILVLDWFR